MGLTNVISLEIDVCTENSTLSELQVFDTPARKSVIEDTDLKNEVRQSLDSRHPPRGLHRCQARDENMHYWPVVG